MIVPDATSHYQRAKSRLIPGQRRGHRHDVFAGLSENVPQFSSRRLADAVASAFCVRSQVPRRKWRLQGVCSYGAENTDCGMYATTGLGRTPLDINTRLPATKRRRNLSVGNWHCIPKRSNIGLKLEKPIRRRPRPEVYTAHRGPYIGELYRGNAIISRLARFASQASHDKW